MAIHPREGKLIYHLTPIENFEGILKSGLLPRKELISFKDIASKEILVKREQYNLEDFVPFHFFVKTPFCGTVQKSNKDSTFIYLAMRRERAKILDFKVLPQHPLTFNGAPMDWDDGMLQIDWELMAKKDYADHDCKEVCMAEAVFNGALTISQIDYIYTKTDGSTATIIELLRRYNVMDVTVSTAPYMFVSND